MALATTQAVWRSGGGDQTRTAYCGSMVMAAQFHVANASVASATNVQVSSVDTSPVILPAGAIVLAVNITAVDSQAGAIDIGWETLDGASSNVDGIVEAFTIARGTITPGATGDGDDMGLVMSATKMVYVTAIDGGSGAGSCDGIIQYYIADNGQQNV